MSAASAAAGPATGPATGSPGGPAGRSAVDAGRARPGATLIAVVVAQFMVTLDLSVVNVGLPQIARGLGFDTGGLTWVINAYALTFGGFLLLGGKAADSYGRKRMLVAGLLLFGAACLFGGSRSSPAS